MRMTARPPNELALIQHVPSRWDSVDDGCRRRVVVADAPPEDSTMSRLRAQ
jgi:hypothetical protein